MVNSGRFSDARELDDGATIKSDVCVVGAGAAGIVTALELSKAGHDTVLLEAGGRRPDSWTNSQFTGQNLGLPYHDLHECRTHRFGGTTYDYGGFSKPVSERDFAPVPGAPLATWPISFGEIAPWVDAASRRLGFSSADFDVDEQIARAGLPPAHAHDEMAETALFAKFDPRPKSYPELFDEELASARRLRILLHAIATKIRLDPNGRIVTRLEVGTQAGTRLRIESRRYVLACHSVENARLLLDSDDVAPEGVGNQSGLLGRCLMDHPHVEAGRVKFHSDPPLHLVLPMMNRKGFSACVTAPRAVTERESCFQYFCRLLPREYDTSGEVAAQGLVKHRRRPHSREFRHALAGAVRDPLDAALAIAHRVGIRPREFVLNHRIEQAPNTSSRVVLLDECDDLGRRRAGVSWQLSEVDLRTLRVGQECATRYLLHAGARRVMPATISEDLLTERGSTYWHQMGTTRMSASPAEGVVDRDCRVHGVDNLFVAGSSVFCRGTFSPPTMTITALALRLADHLNTDLRRRTT